MFFSPTLIALTKPELQNHLRILCLGAGTADNLGATRRKELTASALPLGIRSQSDVSYLDDQEHFSDSQHITWNPHLIADTLNAQLVSSIDRTPGLSSPTTDIDILITFDQRGTPNCINHTALYEGARLWLQELSHRYAPTGSSCPVSLYTLTSISWARNYSSVLDVIASAFRLCRHRNDSREGHLPLASEKLGPQEVIFVSDFAGFRRAQRAMFSAHQSQMRWFRWVWIGISRYMIINDLVREDV